MFHIEYCFVIICVAEVFRETSIAKAYVPFVRRNVAEERVGVLAVGPERAGGLSSFQ
jgi:hypothetical protein